MLGVQPTQVYRLMVAPVAATVPQKNGEIMGESACEDVNVNL